MLARNPLQLSPELSESIGEARDLFNAARGIAFQVDQISDDVHNLYPDTFEDFDLGEIGARTDQWLSEDRAALERAMRAEAQAAQSIETARGRIDRAMSASADAEGQTGAVQAGNQLLGINAAQLAEIHALLVAQGRALTTERLERVAREQRAQEIQRRAFPTQSSGELTPARTAF
jgi:P-type conjugative transfer protein TrbJ